MSDHIPHWGHATPRSPIALSKLIISLTMISHGYHQFLNGKHDPKPKNKAVKQNPSFEQNDKQWPDQSNDYI